jgi:hypothetical protein
LFWATSVFRGLSFVKSGSFFEFALVLLYEPSNSAPNQFKIQGDKTMRKYVTGVVSTLVALTGFTVFGAVPFQSLKVHITEAAHIAQSDLPAGDYTIRYVDVGGDVPYLSFEPAKGNIIIVPAMRNQLMNGEAAEKSSLVFEKTGGNLFLARVQVEGFNYSYEIIGRRQDLTPTITH